VQVLDRAETLPMAYDPCEPEPPRRAPGGARTVCVRDVSWHAQQPVLLSVGWANRRSGSVVARHEWKGLGKLGGRLEDWVDKQGAEYAERARRAPAAAATRVPGAFDSGDEDAWTDEEE
jgi:WD repeat-containing protein 23